MGDQRNGGIAWTEETWNPLRGCSRVSEGCRNCYAETVAKRFSGPGQPYEGLISTGEKGARWSGTVRLVAEKLGEPLRWKRPRRVFVNSMSDLFHESVAFETIDAIFGVMAACRYIGRDARPGHVFQILTKRPERMHEYLSSDRRAQWAAAAARHGGGHDPDGIYDQTVFGPIALPNVWLGVSVEDQASADARIPLLLETPAAVRWVSYEPALGPIDFNGITLDDHSNLSAFRVNSDENGLDWIVVGGESGPGARPFDLAWARSVIEQTRETGCRAFVKQLGARAVEEGCEEGLVFVGKNPAVLTRLTHRKGGDPSEWPEDLRVREWPEVSR